MPERPNTMPPIMAFEYNPTNSAPIIDGKRLKEINPGIENGHEAAQRAAWCFANCAAVHKAIEKLSEEDKKTKGTICVICTDNGEGYQGRIFIAASVEKGDKGDKKPDEIIYTIWARNGIQEAVQCPYSSTYPTDTEK